MAQGKPVHSDVYKSGPESAWEEEGVNCLNFSGKVSEAPTTAKTVALGHVCALETFLKAILDNWLERKPRWRDSRRKWEDVGDDLLLPLQKHRSFHRNRGLVLF